MTFSTLLRLSRPPEKAWPPASSEPEEVAPALEEDFSTYADMAALLTDPRGIYTEVEDFRTDRMTLDTAVGLAPSTQALRYNYPAGSATDYTISRCIDMPAGVTNEVWVEAVVRWSEDFTIAGNGQPAGSALKLLHVNQSGSAGRWGLNIEGSTLRAEGPNDAYGALYINPSPAASVTTLFDGADHVLRYHVRLGALAFHEFWADGVYYGSAEAATGSSSLNNVSLCRNLNKLSAVDMELWWLRIRIYDTDPGWS